MRTAADWLDEYGVSHQDHANKALHWICVPIIVWCVIGFMWCVPVPAAVRSYGPFANWATLTVLGAVLYYASLSISLCLGAACAFAAMLASIEILQRSAWAPLWVVCAVLFVFAWVGQFIGHGIEGRRPSFFKDVQFLLIGPLWLMAALYRRLGIGY